MFHHITVLKEEATEGLHIKKDGIYVDCTLGGAGHSALIASKLSGEGRLICLDQDDWALENAKERLAEYGDKVVLIKTNFRDLESVLKDVPFVPQKDGIPQVDGVLFDLGVSSPQFDEGERGFSYNHDAPLDMRMDQTALLTAADIVNTWSEQEIARVLFQYGEEKFSRRIAKKIVDRREESPVETTGELAELIKEGIPAAARRTGGHPAKRSFQGLRIAVNDELGAFEEGLHSAVRCLAPEGRVSVITFHSLEDRICKQILSSYLSRCTCPPDFPFCVCGAKGTLKLINRKPLVPSEEELELNTRARSAKLRIAEKIVIDDKGESEMAYTRGNLAVQPKRKEEVNPLYREKTKVVTKRRVLPLQEKLLYMLTLGVCVLVAITLISRYVHIYDLNLQAQKLDKDIATAKKQISTYEMEKQNLEQKVAQKAKDLGYVAPDENATIFIPANPVSTEGDN